MHINARFSGGTTPGGELIISALSDVLMKESRVFTRTYNHVVADVAERGLLKYVLHEAVSRRVHLHRIARLGA